MELSTDDVTAVYDQVVAKPTAGTGAINKAIAAKAKMNGVHLLAIIKRTTKSQYITYANIHTVIFEL